MSIPMDKAMANPVMARAIRAQTAKDLAERLGALRARETPTQSLIPPGSSSRAIRFTVEGKPLSVNHLYRNLRGRGRVLTAAGRAWKRKVAAAARAACRAPLAGPVAVQLDVYFDSRRGDLDNSCKSVLDGMSGVVFGDDRQVTRLLLVRYLDRAHPRVEVEVQESRHVREGGSR